MIEKLFLQKVVNNEVGEFADQIGIFKTEIMSAYCRELINTYVNMFNW